MARPDLGVMQGTEPTPNPFDARTEAAPGDELPSAVYRSVVFALAWMMLAAWLAFGKSAGTDLDLVIASVLCAVFLSIPFILHRTASKGSPAQPERETIYPIELRHGNRDNFGQGGVAADKLDTDCAGACSNSYWRGFRVDELMRTSRPGFISSQRSHPPRSSFGTIVTSRTRRKSVTAFTGFVMKRTPRGK